MSKIINENGKYKIEFAKDSFGPYESVFSRTDCYYNDELQDRGSVLFPYKNKEFNNTEIFLETDDIVVCTGDRTNLSGEEKTFIDIINLKTEKKQRLYVDEVNLIYNGEKEIVVNANFNGVWKTVKLDNETMEIKEEKEEKLLAFFKLIFNYDTKCSFRLDYNELKYYKLIEVLEDISYIKNFDRRHIIIDYINKKGIELKEEDLTNIQQYGFINENQKYDKKMVCNYANTQNYLMDNNLRKKVIFNTQEPLRNYFVLLFFLIFAILMNSPTFFEYILDLSTYNYPTIWIFILIIVLSICNINFYHQSIKFASVYRQKISGIFNVSDYKIIYPSPTVKMSNKHRYIRKLK